MRILTLVSGQVVVPYLPDTNPGDDPAPWTILIWPDRTAFDADQKAGNQDRARFPASPIGVSGSDANTVLTNLVSAGSVAGLDLANAALSDV